MNEPITLMLPWPPSVNGYWVPSVAFRKGTRKAYGYLRLSAEAEAYRGRVMRMLQERQAEPIRGRCIVRVRLSPPDKRRRDIDNYHKPLLDALTHAGVWGDDSQAVELHTEWKKMCRGGRVSITVEVLTDPQGQLFE